MYSSIKVELRDLRFHISKRSWNNFDDCPWLSIVRSAHLHKLAAKKRFNHLRLAAGLSSSLLSRPTHLSKTQKANLDPAKPANVVAATLTTFVKTSAAESSHVISVASIRPRLKSGANSSSRISWRPQWQQWLGIITNTKRQTPGNDIQVISHSPLISQFIY